MVARIARTRSRFPRPQRDNSGIVFPEHALYAVIHPIADALKRGKLGEGSRHEPMFSAITGVSQELIESVFEVLQDSPPKISMAFPPPGTRLEFPVVVIMTEAMDPAAEMLGDAGLDVEEDVTQVTDEVLTASAAGGETTFRLLKRPVVPSSVALNIIRSGATIDMFPVAGDFSVDGEGNITLGAPLVAADSLVATSYYHYGLPPGKTYSTIFKFSASIFTEHVNPIVSSFLFGIIWRELMVQRESLHAAGLSDISMSRRSISVWDQVVPPIGIRSELALTGLVDWTVYAAADPIRHYDVDMSTTESAASVVQLTGDIATFNIEVEE